MAGSMDRCETFTVNCPGPGSSTGSLVSSQSVARGSPDGRAASRTWWLVGVIARLRDVAGSADLTLAPGWVCAPDQAYLGVGVFPPRAHAGSRRRLRLFPLEPRELARCCLQ